jgi:hypothetical protein
MRNQDISTIGESFAKMFQEIERNTQDAFRKMTESFHEKLHETMQEFQAIAKSFSDALHELPDELRPIITKLSARSWYISGDMDIPFLRRLDENIEISEEAVDKIMSQWVSDNIEKIVERAKERYPERKAIIDAAFWAHDNMKYELSIPILLIQIDGMGYEKFKFSKGKCLYSKNGDKTIIGEITDYYINNQNSFTELLLMQLREKSPLIVSSKESADYPDAINRHNIIHGINTGYATQLNSLKVFSLLEYFISFFSETDFNEKNAD